MRISTAVYDAVTTLSRREPTVEVCGLLFGSADAVNGFLPARNVHARPTHRFEIDPATLLAAHRAERDGGPQIAGCYHSHPSGSPDPSEQDAADTAPNGWLWLILGRERAALWRAVATGERHGRFDPVPFTCVDGPDPPESALSSRVRP